MLRLLSIDGAPSCVDFELPSDLAFDFAGAELVATFAFGAWAVVLSLSTAAGIVTGAFAPPAVFSAACVGVFTGTVMGAARASRFPAGAAKAVNALFD
jgi:hypothetical protein